jgi:murein DD-endopeptidase MepM/ murein hydrolase activator NlpD
MWSGPFRPPVEAPPADSYGTAMTYVGGSPVERYTDSVWGEYHRGLDYAVPEGTNVVAPAGGVVVLAQPLTLTGNTLVIDHGQSVVSVFYHLARIDVGVGAALGAGTRVGSAGQTGIAAEPHAHWGVYVDGVAVDPRVFLRGVE